MGLCYAPDCSHTYKNGCNMFTFPKEEHLKKKWETLLRRADRQPNRFSVVCSCHFVDKKKENLPTLYARNNFQFTPPAPEVRKRQKTRTVINEETPVSHSHQSTTPTEKRTLGDPTPSTSRSAVLLEAETYFQRKKLDSLQSKVANVSLAFGYNTLKDDNKLVHLYTGLPDASVFKSLCNYVCKFKINYYHGWTVEKLSKEDQLLLTPANTKAHILHRPT